MTQLDENDDHDRQIVIKIFGEFPSMKPLTKPNFGKTKCWRGPHLEIQIMSNHFFPFIVDKMWCLLSAKQQTRYDYENNGTGNDSETIILSKMSQVKRALKELQQKLYSVVNGGKIIIERFLKQKKSFLTDQRKFFSIDFF